mmetsp:Transcript_14237/g.10295  ORF Transcript_14237/g.10295 Transcript_14237/m.10295 type:complete len:154 (+) Transcript_14237:627-1088(+)
MASKKITSTFMLYPLLAFGFTLFLYYILDTFTDHSFFRNCMHCLIFLLFFPVYSYICILARDNLLFYYKMLQAKFFILFYTEHMFQIQQTRKALKEKIVALVEELGNQTFKDFDKIRLVKAYSEQIDEKEKQQKVASEMEISEAFSVLSEIGI